jgi:hypothetical protein
MDPVPSPEMIRTDDEYRQALQVIKRSVMSSAGQVDSLQERIRGVCLFPPTDCSDEVLHAFMRDNSTREGDDIRVQVLFRLRDHVVRLERQFDRLTTHGLKGTAKDRIKMASIVNAAERSYQQALKMLHDSVRFITDTDLKVHSEARSTLGMAADVALRERELDIKDREAARKQQGGLREVLAKLADEDRDAAED